jgi:hypothetical protein
VAKQSAKNASPFANNAAPDGSIAFIVCA